MKISESKNWSSEEVRRMCIAHSYYTAGDYRAYEALLKWVNTIAPTKQNIYKVALDIFLHSDIDLDRYGVDEDEMISAIMFDISRECVSTHYAINR